MRIMNVLSAAVLAGCGGADLELTERKKFSSHLGFPVYQEEYLFGFQDAAGVAYPSPTDSLEFRGFKGWLEPTEVYHRIQIPGCFDISSYKEIENIRTIRNKERYALLDSSGSEILSFELKGKKERIQFMVLKDAGGNLLIPHMEFSWKTITRISGGFFLINANRDTKSCDFDSLPRADPVR